MLILIDLFFNMANELNIYKKKLLIAAYANNLLSILK